SGTRIFLAWAKPVLFNPLLLRDQKWGTAKIALAGPLSNVAIALLFGLLLRFWPLGTAPFFLNLGEFFALIVIVNLSLAIFNLMPVPPLDGSHILFALLPRSLDRLKDPLMNYGAVLLVVFVVFFAGFISPIVQLFFRLIVGSPMI
ncbi:MAG: site-2 protease family protein, partial [Candidatus Pacebacteria bacterium]|nr:site-2 protease family protein [Candidatus Paceibacterota bacterium]